MLKHFAILLLATAALLADGRTLFRYPTVSKTHIVFQYADDLWIVPRAGGEAIRLTTGPGLETAARFSPDGTMVAFTGEYDGNLDVFVVPTAGGEPKRLTFHPDPDVVTGWTPETRVGNARGSSEVPTTASAPGGRLMVPVMLSTVRFDPAGAPFAT